MAADRSGRSRTTEELQSLAEEGARTLAGASAEEIIAWAQATFGSRVAVASSMQDAVLPALVASVAPGTDVLFLETGYHFAETLATRDEVASRYRLNVRDIRAEQTVAEQDATYGKDLFASNPDLCCMLRKTTPLFEALEGYEAWMTGLRRAESASRAGAPEVSFDAKHGLVKISPIVAWSDEQVEAYARDNDVVRNPLLDQGYPSIGCAPCTRKVAPGEDPRSGRWAGTDKTECGIHVD
ncbi:MAG: phosphoadenylyl-sulfate reductase [Dermatophilus congolensis]|nr:phosphoadenylyl-sulfate reductase [Dermatophilus congolensis]